MDRMLSQGFWWLPGKEDSRVAGDLFFDCLKGARLELRGAFLDAEDPEKPFDPDIVLGTALGRDTTLVGCREASRTGTGRESERQVFTASFVLLGNHFAESNEVFFDSVTVKYSTLPLLFRSGPIHVDPRKSTEFQFVPPREMVADTRVGHVTLEHVLRTRHGSWRATLEADPALHLLARNPLDLAGWICTFIRPLQNLLTLLSCRPSIPTGLQVRRHGTERYPDIEVLFRPFGESGSEEDNPPVGLPLLYFENIHEEFGAIVTRWFELSVQLEHPINLWFGTQYNPNMFLEQHFLLLAQSLETYHRCCQKFHQQTFDKPTHDERIATVLKAVPAHAEWLMEALRWSNEPTFRSRLADILGFAGRPLQRLIPDSRAFIGRIVATRNYYTHYSQESKSQAVTGVNLLRLLPQMHYLIMAVLLLDLGFGEAKVKSLLEGNPDYRRELRC